MFANDTGVVLEVEVEADSEAVVLAAVNVFLRTCSSLSGNFAVVVESAHITQVDAESVCGMNAETTTYHIVRKAVREVVHVLVAKSVTSDFPRARNGNELVDVVFCTQNELVSVVVDEFLLVQILCGNLIEELMVAGTKTELLDGRVLSAKSQECRNVLANLLAVLKLPEN